MVGAKGNMMSRVPELSGTATFLGGVACPSEPWGLKNVTGVGANWHAASVDCYFQSLEPEPRKLYGENGCLLGPWHLAGCLLSVMFTFLITLVRLGITMETVFWVPIRASPEWFNWARETHPAC